MTPLEDDPPVLRTIHPARILSVGGIAAMGRERAARPLMNTRPDVPVARFAPSRRLWIEISMGGMMTWELSEQLCTASAIVHGVNALGTRPARRSGHVGIHRLGKYSFCDCNAAVSQNSI